MVAIAICHGLALFVAVAIGANISGGHVNPAVTFGLAVGGQITILTGIFYWIAQLAGSVVACYLLKVVTGGLVITYLLCHINLLSVRVVLYCIKVGSFCENEILLKFAYILPS